MNKLLKLICSVALLGATVVCATACSQWETPYSSVDGEGYNVSVRFDANGGVFAGTKDVYVVDVFNPDHAQTNASGNKEIALISPDDPLRKTNAFEISRTDYFLAGWYQTRELRTDEAGNALDDYGQLCSISGLPQGYIYSNRWNFDNDRLEIDPNKNYSSAENAMTLYAGWIPYFSYEFYAENPTTGQFELFDTRQMIELSIPEWNTETGTLDMKKFPTRTDYTFDAAYLSPDTEHAQPISGSIGGEVDYEHGVATVGTVKIYTTWREGNWFRIYTAKQFYDNSRPGGCYEICADLDFSNVIWAPTLAKNSFTGTILGNGHTISNVHVIQADYSQIHGGLFGAIGAGAQITDLCFENVSYTVSKGSRMQDASFGLLAGTISSEAVLTNVSVSGELLIGEDCNFEKDYRMGLLCGTGGFGNIDLTNIACRAEETDENPYEITVDPVDHTVTLTRKP